MARFKRIGANQRGADDPGGPLPSDGETPSDLFVRGLHAQSLVIPGEDAAELETLAREYFAEYQPLTPTERHYVQRLVLSDWLRRRCLRIQAEVLTHLVKRHAGNWPEPHDEDAAVGQQVVSDTQNGDATVKLFRQLIANDRCYDRALAALTRIQSHTQPPVPAVGELGSFRQTEPAGHLPEAA
jgi:hypothetical protein